MCPNTPSKLIRALWANTISYISVSAQDPPNAEPRQGPETGSLFGM